MKAKLYALLVITVTLNSNALLRAQSPGGVSANLKLWIKPDIGISSTGGLVDSWTYANDGTKIFTAVGTQRPQLVTLNFLQVPLFDGLNDLMDGPVGVNAPITAGDDDYTVFAVWRTSSLNRFQRIWSQRNPAANDNGSFSLATWDDGTYGDETAITPFQHTMTGSTSGRWGVSEFTLRNTPTGDLTFRDLNYNSTGLTVNTDPATVNGPALRNIGTVVNRLGANYGGGNVSFLEGGLAELIVYDSELTVAERSRVFSYLQLKYGLSLVNASVADIVNSSNNVIWSLALNNSYPYRVFGIGRDNQTGLLIQNAHNATIAGVAPDLTVSNPSALSTDNSFLIVADNDGAAAESTTDLPLLAAGSRRLFREWKAQVTGTVGTVSLAFNLGGLSITGTTAPQFKVMVDADGDGDFTTGTVRYYGATSYTAGVATFDNVTLNNGEVFALITSASDITLPVTWISFNASRQGTAAVLNWVVGENESAKQYEIEVSKDGSNFIKAGIVTNDVNKKAYTYNYPSLSGGKTYFRIYQVDFDGRYSYSKTVSVDAPFVWLTVLNNPVRTNSVNLDLESQENGRAYSIEVISLNGATILSKQGLLNAGRTRLAVPLDKAPSGNYILKVSSGGQSSTTTIVKY